MNDNDRALIIDLIAGNLDPAAASAAEERIAASPELSAELAAQRFALTELATRPKPRLTSEERTALRADLAVALNLESSVAPVAVTRSRARWWAPMAGLAAAAVVFLGFVVVGGGLGSSDDSESAPFAAAETTTTAAAESIGQADAQVQAPQDPADTRSSSAEEQATAEGDATLVTPDLESTAALSSMMLIPDFPEGLPAAADLYALLEASEFSLDTFTNSLQALGAEGFTSVSTESANECGGVAGDLYDTFHVVAAAATEEEPPAASYVFHSAEAGDQIMNVAIESCTVLDASTGSGS